MKKLLSVLLALTMILSLVACGGGSKQEAKVEAVGESAQTEAAKTSSGEDHYELALVTDSGTIDDKSFNQGAWEGMTKYAREKNITYKYYQPSVQEDAEYKKKIDQAIKDGAKVVVCPGFHFATAVASAQEQYPEVCFIILDSEPAGKTLNNTMPILYQEDQAGFLAGYAAVKDGNKNFGFLGGQAVPAVVRFGFGYLQGIDAAANELGIDCDVHYHYTGGFVPTPEAQTLASSWYQTGTEVVFGCGGKVGNSAMSAAQEKNEMEGTIVAKIIGVDIDQSQESDAIITSAIKNVNNSVYDAITMYYEGKFPGGKTTIFNAENNGVGLAMEHNRFSSFNQSDYESLYADLKGGKWTIKNDTTVADPTKANLGLTRTKVDFVK